MDGIVDVEADPQSYVLIQYKRENKKAVAKIHHNGGGGQYLLIKAPKTRPNPS
jgi:hypothetical protein